MSTIIMSACWPLQGMSAAQKAVLVSMADNANDEGVCWPSVATITMRTCLSERAVQYSITWLVNAGALRITKRNGRSTVYRVTPAAYAPPQGMHPRKSCTPAPDAPTPADVAPPPPHLLHPTPAPVAPRTVKEPSSEPSRNRKARSASGFDAGAIDLPDWLDRDDWQRWVKDRRDRKKTITEEAARLQIKSLDDYRLDGFAAATVIDHCIKNGYQGLFPPNAPKAKGGNAGKFNPVAHMNQASQDQENDEYRTIDLDDDSVRVA